MSEILDDDDDDSELKNIWDPNDDANDDDDDNYDVLQHVWDQARGAQQTRLHLGPHVKLWVSAQVPRPRLPHLTQVGANIVKI